MMRSIKDDYYMIIKVGRDEAFVYSENEDTYFAHLNGKGFWTKKKKVIRIKAMKMYRGKALPVFRMKQNKVHLDPNIGWQHNKL